MDRKKGSNTSSHIRQCKVLKFAHSPSCVQLICCSLRVQVGHKSSLVPMYLFISSISGVSFFKGKNIQAQVTRNTNMYEHLLKLQEPHGVKSSEILPKVDDHDLCGAIFLD